MNILDLLSMVALVSSYATFSWHCSHVYNVRTYVHVCFFGTVQLHLQPLSILHMNDFMYRTDSNTTRSDPDEF